MVARRSRSTWRRPEPPGRRRRLRRGRTSGLGSVGLTEARRGRGRRPQHTSRCRWRRSRWTRTPRTARRRPPGRRPAPSDGRRRLGGRRRRRLAVAVGARGAERARPRRASARTSGGRAPGRRRCRRLAEVELDPGSTGQHERERARPPRPRRLAPDGRHRAIRRARPPGRRRRTGRRAARPAWPALQANRRPWRAVSRAGRRARRRCRSAARRPRRRRSTADDLVDGVARRPRRSTRRPSRSGVKHVRRPLGRGRPGRGARSTSAKPAARASSATASPCVSPISTTSAPPGASHVGAPATICSIASSPVGPATQRARRLPVAPPRRAAGRRRRRRAGWPRRRRPGRAGRRAAPRTSRPRPDAHARRRPCPRPARLARATASASAERRSPTPRRPATLGRERQRDGARAGAEVDDATRPGRRARRAASSWRSAVDDPSVSGRGISTRRSTSRSSVRNAQRPSTYCSGSPASRRATMRVERGDAPLGGRRRPRPAPARRRRSPLASSTIQRASLRRHPSTAAAACQPVAPARYVARGSAPGPASGAARARAGRRLLVGDERVDDLVELAGQHLVELVEREADAVVGDPVLLEVVGADLLDRPPPPTWSCAGRRTARPPAGPARASAAGRAAPACALARFWIWLFSSCIDTTSPVGLWVMRTAESVVLTDCPPGPDER